MAVNNPAKWATLRSDIYIRDKGICWICNEFVNLRDYDLGHLIDRCKGGLEAYDNLAVMHHYCNRSKPRHLTLQEAIRWKLTPAYLNRTPTKTLPKPKVSESSIALASFRRYGYSPLMAAFTPDDRNAIKQLIIEYFTGHPELSQDKDRYSNHKIRAIRQLAATLNIGVADIRLILAKYKTDQSATLRIS